MKKRLACSAAALSLAGLLGAAQASAPTDAEILKKKSQEFSDASAAGDASVFLRDLNDRVTFMNETGELASKKDIVDGAAPSTNAAISQHLTQSDFAVQIFGKVAVTSFTDTADVKFYGQSLQRNFRSTEVWLKQGAGWTMISSQTVALADDPPAVQLSVSQLNEYVGRYEAAPGYVLTVSNHDGALTGSVNGGAEFPMKVEVRDVLFTPGQPDLRRIFQRNGEGAIIGFASRRGGHDLILKKTA